MVRKVKWGDFEAEFEEQITRLEEKVLVAETQATLRPATAKGVAPLHRSYVAEYQQIVSSPASFREKIILGAVLAERMIQETVREFGVDRAGRLPAKDAMESLCKEGLVSRAEVEAFDEFWKVRNAVVHNSGEEISDRQAARLLDLLWRLVRVFG